MRNSGAIAVVEGVGDHGCEYMTGGVVVCSGIPGATSLPACPAASPMCWTKQAISPRRCNLAMVELEPVQGEEDDLLERLSITMAATSKPTGVDVCSDMTRYDAERLQVS